MSAVSAQAGAVGAVARPPATQGRATEGPAARRAGWAAQSAFLARAFSQEGFGEEIQQSYKASLSRDYDFSTHVRYE